MVCSTWATKKTTYLRICAPQPRCGPVWAFPGQGGNLPLPGKAKATSERVAGTEERLVPVILNAVKNPFSPLRANRDVARRPEAVGRILRLRFAPLRMTASNSLRGTAARDVRRCWQSSPFPSACAICPLGEETAPTGRGMRKQDKAAGHHTRRGPHRTAEPTGKTEVFRGFPPPPVGSAQRVQSCQVTPLRCDAEARKPRFFGAFRGVKNQN